MYMHMYMHMFSKAFIELRCVLCVMSDVMFVMCEVLVQRNNAESHGF